MTWEIIGKALTIWFILAILIAVACYVIRHWNSLKHLCAAIPDDYDPEDECEPVLHNEKERIFQNAFDTYGEEMQIVVCMEEMSELTKELSKVIRGNGNMANIIEEIADVELTVEEMKFLFNCAREVDRQKDKKLKRLEDRINGKA